MPKEKLSIIIPAYNEENVICSTLEEIQGALDNNNEIIVVDDGSTDKTSDLVIENFPNVKLIRISKNKGKGAAVKKGVMNASGDLILFLDADGSTPFHHVFDFLETIKNYDIVIGSRTLPESNIIKKQPLYKVFLGKCGNLLIRFILNINYSDTQCGFKMFRRDSAREIFSKLQCNKWAFDFEVLKIAQLKNMSVKEIPVSWKNDPNTNVSFLDYFTTLKNLIEIKLRYRKDTNDQ